jgi:hypothetical protein
MVVALAAETAEATLATLASLTGLYTSRDGKSKHKSHIRP